MLLMSQQKLLAGFFSFFCNFYGVIFPEATKRTPVKNQKNGSHQP
jgi:hypothetical protein